jgi:hypothetical protein
MAGINAFAISSMAIKGMEAGLEGASEFLSNVDTRYASDFENKGINTGQSIEIVLPPRPNPWVEGREMEASATEHERVTLTVRQFNTGRVISDAELALSDKEFFEEVIRPDVNGGVREAEQRCLRDILSQASMANTASVGVRPASAAVWTETVAMARNMLIPEQREQVCAMLDHITMGKLASNEATLFRPAELVDSAALKGRVKELGGVGKMYGSVNIQSHTNGNGNVVGVLVNGASQSGSALVCDAATFASTFTKGSQFFIGGSPAVNAVDPEKKDVLSFPQIFTLTQDAVADGAGNVTLAFAPAIVLTGSLKNVSAAPQNNATVTFLGAASKRYRQNLLYSPESVAFVGLPLPALKNRGGDVKVSRHKNIPIRTVFFSDFKGGLDYLRYDLFFGIAVKRWQWMWRVWDLEETP